MPRVRLHPEQREALARAAALRQPGEAALRRQEEADERELQRNLFGARVLELAAAQRLREIREVATAGRGFDSEQAMADADRAIDETRMSFVRDAPNATIREMLADVFDQRAGVLRHELGAHVEREKFQARIDVSMQRQAMAQQDAVAARTLLAFATNIRTAFDEIDRQAELTSLAPEQAAATTTRLLSAAHFGRLERLADEGDLAGASAYHAEHSGEMSPADDARAVARLAIPSESASSVPGETGSLPGTFDRPAEAGAIGEEPRFINFAFDAGQALTGPLQLHPAAAQQPRPQSGAAGANSKAINTALQWATRLVNNEDYQYRDPHGSVGGWKGERIGGIGTPKCNVFVGDAYAAAGISLRDPSNPKVYLTTKAWSNPKSQIAGFRTLKPGEQPQPGDIVSDSGHMGLFVPGPRGENRTISAASPEKGDKVVHNDWGFRAGQKVVIWRYVGGTGGPPSPPKPQRSDFWSR